MKSYTGVTTSKLAKTRIILESNIIGLREKAKKRERPLAVP